MAKKVSGALFLDGRLQANTTYTYRVRAENLVGRSEYSAKASSITSSSGADIPLSALKLWLKADCGRGGSPVPFWMDQSGTRNHAEQELSSSDRRLIAVENGIATNKPVIGFFTKNFLLFRYHTDIAWTEKGLLILTYRTTRASRLALKVNPQWNLLPNAKADSYLENG